jgi:outer membrane murein-binding lipoprotein Lpp
MTPAELDEFFLRVTTYFDGKIDDLSTEVRQLSTEVRQLSTEVRQLNK